MGSNASGVFMKTCMDCWVKGVRVIRTDTTGVSELFSFMLVDSLRPTFQSNYAYGSRHDYHATPQNQNYAMTIIATTSPLIENNIFHRNPAGPTINGPVLGGVFAYNYVVAASYTSGGTVYHGTSLYNLHEGNDMSGVLLDIIHGPHDFETAFRNLFDNDDNNPSVNVATPIAVQSKSRFANVVGNVMGDAGLTTYETTLADCGDCVYKLGWQGNDSITGPSLVTNDTNVKRTLLRWGNWDTKSNATRWCGQSGNTGWATTCSGTTEVPSGIANFPNTIPAMETLPNSLYLSAKPSWFQSITWPPVGPDVTGGAIAGYANHAHKIPARVCYESMSDDSAYTTGTVKSFNRTTCYGS
jgi:hypothetical protein